MFITFIFKKSSQRYLFSTNISLLVNINLSLLKIIFKLFLLNYEPDTKFFLISAVCSTLLKVRSFPKIIFSMTFPIPSALKVDEFSMYWFYPSTSFVSGKYHLLGAHMFCSTNKNPTLLRIVD